MNSKYSYKITGTNHTGSVQILSQHKTLAAALKNLQKLKGMRYYDAKLEEIQSK